MINHLFESFQDFSLQGLMKIYVLKWVAMPLMHEMCTKAEYSDIIDQKLISLMNGHIWCSELAETDDICRVEYLQLTTLLLDHASSKVSDYRKEIIRQV
jgi:hypothetical protein